MKIRLQALAVALVLPTLAVGCANVRAKAAFKDGNKDYKEEKFRQAIENYQRAIQYEPCMTEAWFYLGSSQQALYRPGKGDDPENKKRLEDAIASFTKSIECNKGQSDNDKQLKLNALGSLTGIYSEEPYRSFEESYKYAQQLVAVDDKDPKNLYALANLYEKFNKVQEAEDTYKKVVELYPQDTKACGALAAFYNKPNWDDTGAIYVEGGDKARRSRFDQAIEVLTRCAGLAPEDATGWQKVATFYWDKAYRDPLLTDDQKIAYADKGLEAVDKALAVNPSYFDAVIFKGLLLRVKASAISDPRQKHALMEKAGEYQRMGVEIRKQQQAEQAAAAAAAAQQAAQGGTK